MDTRESQGENVDVDDVVQGLLTKLTILTFENVKLEALLKKRDATILELNEVIKDQVRAHMKEDVDA